MATALTPPKLVLALEASTRVAVTVSALSASAAVIYGVITATGLLVKVTSIILALSSGSVVVAIVLIGIMSYVLGMGLPVTASYVLIAALGAPALAELGLPVLAAHLIIFWFSQDSTITPPICMTAFVAARIADAPPMRTGWECVKMAKALYVMPFVFAFGSLLSDSWVEILFDALPLAGLFTVLPMVVEGYATRRLLWGHRLLLLLPAFGFLMATVGTSGQGIGWLLGSAASALLVLGEAHRRNLQPLVAGPALAAGTGPGSTATTEMVDEQR